MLSALGVARSLNMIGVFEVSAVNDADSGRWKE